MKTYIKHSFISKLPLFIIIIAILLTIALSTAGNYSFDYPEDFTNMYMIVIHAIAVILPLFGMSYRYSLVKSDIYKQVAFKDKAIRIADHLLLVGVLLTAFTITFPILCYTIIMRNYSLTSVNLLNYGYLVPQYFFALVTIILTYGFSYFIIQYPNNLINSIILAFVAQFLIAGFLGSLGQLLSRESGFYGDYIFPILLPSSLSYNIFGSLVASNRADIVDYFQAYRGGNLQLTTHGFLLILSCILFITIATLGIIKLFNGKDPSAEWAGKPGCKSPLQSIIFHAGFFFGMSFLALGTTNSSTMMFFIVVVSMIALYFTLYGLLRKNFKFERTEFLIFFSVIIGSLLYSLIIYAAVDHSY